MKMNLNYKIYRVEFAHSCILLKIVYFMVSKHVFHKKKLKFQWTEILLFISEVLLVIKILANYVVVFYLLETSDIVMLVVTKCDKH